MQRLIRSRDFGLSLLILTGIFGAIPAPAQQPFADTRRQLEKAFEAEKNTVAGDWDALADAQQQEWNRLRRQIRKKWQTVVLSSRRQWVTYSAEKDARGRVDFENGRIIIETILPADTMDARHRAGRKIYEQIKAVLEKQAAPGRPVLQNQLRHKDGRPVTADTLDTFFASEIAPAIEPDSSGYIAEDGQKRLRYQATCKLVPEHLDIRAKDYVPAVTANADRFGLDPRLLMAIIHTESYFNPLAVSSAGAIGLMQIIPRYAGREAQAFLYQRDQPLAPDYLYAPGINLELGAAYVHLLQNRYFKDIPDPRKRLYLTVCAYNWGPTAVRKKIINRYDVAGMSAEALFSLLAAHTPAETSEYLERVTRRIAVYDPYFS